MCVCLLFEREREREREREMYRARPERLSRPPVMWSEKHVGVGWLTVKLEERGKWGRRGPEKE